MNKKSTSIILLSSLLMMLSTESFAAEIAFEYEAEKEKATGVWSDTLYVMPKFEINQPLADSVEILLGRSQDRSGENTTANTLGVRLRKNAELSNNLEGFARIAVAKSFSDRGDWSWAYVEPGIEYKLSHNWSLGLSDRLQNSIDGSANRRTNSLRIGPNYEIDQNSELEMRYISTSGDYDSESYMVEYGLHF